VTSPEGVYRPFQVGLLSDSAELRVLALIDHLALGGAEMLLGQFAAAAPRAGIRLSVACLGQHDGNPAAEPLRAAGVDPVILNTPQRLGLRALSQVRRHIAEKQPDIVHTHLGTSSCLGSLAARSLKIPAVSSIHAMAWGGDVRTRVRLSLCAVAQRYGAARIITVSESARSAYLANRWHVPSRVVTIHNGIDVSPEHGAAVEVRRELGFEPDDVVVGMVSALRPEKGHDIAIEALRLLRRRFPQLRLLIAGDGPARAGIAQFADPLGDAVVMAGRRSDVMRLLDAVDVCLHPSRADAFPTTILEAMAASVPVVATAVGGIPEIVIHNRTGILVSPPPSADRIADALSCLLNDRARLRELGAAGRRRYEAHFTAGPWVRQTRALYDAVLLEARTDGRGGGLAE
jgi:glycosyltransferase involved in cell wall biosynthesis